jgi:hypothetical protein
MMLDACAVATMRRRSMKGNAHAAREAMQQIAAVAMPNSRVSARY